MQKKYELSTDDFVYLDYIGKGSPKAYRIRALRSFGDVNAGDLGGFIASELNLSHSGNCWVYDEARVSDYGRVEGNARVSGHAHIYGRAVVKGNAAISDFAAVCGIAVVSGGTLGGSTMIQASVQAINKRHRNSPPAP
jgi:hypothetical protein